jgi:hypothetical protein
MPKCEIFDGSDFHNSYTIKSQWGPEGAALGLKYKLVILYMGN